MPLQAVVFDFDGLVLDTESAEFEAWSSVYADHGATLDIHEWSKCVGSGPDAWSATGHLCDLIGKKLDEEPLLGLWRDRRNAILIELKPLPGIEQLLDELHAESIPVAIASSSRRLWIDGHLGNLGWQHRFPVIQTRDMVGAPKPSPASYLAACAELGVRADEAVALEDSPHGIEAAKAAGMFCVACPNPITRHYDVSSADLIVESMVDLNVDRLRTLVESEPVRPS